MYQQILNTLAMNLKIGQEILAKNEISSVVFENEAL